MDERTWARFIAKVSLPNANGCMMWLKSTNGKYGQQWVGDIRTSAHRLSYQFFNGVIPDGQLVRHTCDNKLCVAPLHLILGTVQDNTDDMIERQGHPNSRKSQCVQGHPLSGENLRFSSDGRLQCRECTNRRNREYRSRNKK